jgi:dUTP pyrophosphatase
MDIRVKYFNVPEAMQLQQTKVGDWIDLRAVRIEVNGQAIEFDKVGDCVSYNKGDILKIYFGVAMELPKGYEAHVLPRSSTFKNYHMTLVNSMGVIDCTYCGDNDEWFGVFLAHDWGLITRHDRVAQFRIMENMPTLNLIPVEVLGNADRGGHGSTGKQ